MRFGLGKSLFLIGGLFNFAQAATFTSTLAGGNWEDPTTWEEIAVPGENDDVLILGPVDIYTSDSNNPVKVNNVQINSGGILRSRDFSVIRNYYIEVVGNLLNNGTVQDQGAGRLNLTVQGNLQTTGNFDPYVLRTQGDIDNQGTWGVNEIYVEGGSGNRSFLGTAGMPSDIYFEVDVTPEEDWEFSGEINQNNGSKINFTSGRVLKLSHGIRNDFVTTGSGTVELTGTNFQEIRSTIEAEKVLITGTDIRVYNSTELNPITITGDLEVASGGVLTAHSAASLTYRYLEVQGDLTNNGTVQDQGAGRLNLTVQGKLQTTGNFDPYTIRAEGDIDNQGVWSANELYVLGAGNKSLIGTELMASDVFLEVDVTPQEDWEFTGEITQKNNSTVTLSSGRTLKIHQDIKDIFRTTGAGVVELAGDNFQSIRAEIQAEKVLVTGDAVQIYNSTELDPIRITGDLEIAAGGILTAQSSSVLRYRYLEVGGNLTNNGTIQDNIAGRVDARVAGDFQQLGTVTGANINVLKDFLNTGPTYTPNDTFVRWVDDPGAVEYELEFASLYNSWDPAIVLTDNFYNIDSKVSQDWYWRYRTKFVDDSYSSFSTVQFINSPTGHELDAPVITLVTDSTDWANGGDPTITVTIVSTQELNRAEIFYTCNTGTCQTNLVPTINPDEFNITIDRTTFPDGDFSYWIEAENDHAVMGVLGSEIMPETLSEAVVSGGGSKPPEKISQIRALQCEESLYLNFYKPYKAEQVKVYVGQSREDISSQKTSLTLDNYQDQGNGFVSYKVGSLNEAYTHLGGISVGSNNKSSDLSEVVEIEAVDSCENQIEFTLKENDGERRIWEYSFIIFEDQTEDYPKKGENLNLNFSHPDSEDITSKSAIAKYQWTKGSGIWEETIKSDISPYLKTSLFDYNESSERSFVIKNKQGKVLIQKVVSWLIDLESEAGDYSYDYKVSEVDCSELHCKWFVELKNTGKRKWDILYSDWRWKLISDILIEEDEWVIEPFESEVLVDSFKVYKVLFKGDYETLKDNNVGLRVLRNDVFVEGAKIPLISEPKEIEERKFKTSIKGVKIYEAKSQNSKILVTIPEVNSELVVLGKAEDGVKYIDKYKTSRWYKVRSGEIEGWVIATVIRPEWVEFAKYAPNYCNWARPKGKKLQHVVLHGTAGTGSASSVADNIKTSLSIKKDCITAHFFVDQLGEIVQLRAPWVQLSHVGYGSNYHTQVEGWHNINTLGIELINTGANPSVKNRDRFPLAKKSFPLNWKAWTNSWKWGGDSENIKRWEPYSDLQYQELDRLLVYIEESVGIPYEFFNDDNYKSNKLSYFPKEARGTPSEDEEVRQIVLDYYEALNKFKGVVSHQNVTGKWDTGPAFNQEHFNLKHKSQ